MFQKENFKNLTQAEGCSDFFFVSQLSFQRFFSTCHVFNHQGAVFKCLPQVYRIALDSLRRLVVQSVLTLVCISSSQIKDVWDVKPLWLFLLVSLISSVILGGFTSFMNTSISSIQVVFVLVLYLSGWLLRLIVLLQDESGIYSV